VPGEEAGLAEYAFPPILCRMKKPQDLSREEYLEEIKKIRSNPPEMTQKEFWKQYEEMQASREPSLPHGKQERSGAGRRRPAVA
jgi:hypothetical protein